MDLQKRFLVEWRLADRGSGKFPARTVKGPNIGIADIQPAIVNRHGVGVAVAWRLGGKLARDRPFCTAFPDVNAVRSAGPLSLARWRQAAISADVELSAEGRHAVDAEHVAGLAAVRPAGSAFVAVNPCRLIAARENTGPIVRRRGRVQVPLVNDQTHDSGCFPRPHPPTVDPLFPARVAKNVAPVGGLVGIDNGGVQVAIEDRQRVADVVTGRTRSTAILPLAQAAIVDAKINMSIVTRRLIPARTGLQIKRHAASGPRVVPAQDVPQRVVNERVRVHPNREGKVAPSELQ